ncbi:MAG: DNA-directed RNA polymerase subunit A' [Candidatus ainarchaeum sp.]|nr:DNA-directed RNA polymerase subunit A' [Candidatus ainarchaeum sp.]
MSGVKKIKSIEFNILSPEIIRKMSAVEISRSDTYDKDGYPIERGVMDLHLGVISPGLRCKTCGHGMKDCPGHFGHIELTRPVMHPKFTEKILPILQSSCKECGKLLIEDENRTELMRYSQDPDKLAKFIIDTSKTLKKCPHCQTEISKVSLDKPTNFFVDGERLYPSDILDWILKIEDKDLFLFGYSEKLKPQWFILNVLPVPPVSMRPSLSLENVVTAENDLTHMLLNIVRINSRLHENMNAGAPQIIIEDLWDLLQYNVTTYFDNNTAGVPPAKHRSGRALNTLAQRLKGKKGRFRYNLIGKRVNSASRSTISPSTEIAIDELGVPQEVADTLTVSERVTSWNIAKIKDFIMQDKVKYLISKNNRKRIITESNRQEIIDALEEGTIAKRKMVDGDLVIFNRQPTLHRSSIMGHKVKVLPGKTFRLNPISCAPYNADFDGDEMQIHAPQSESSIAEIKNLLMVNNHVLSIRHGKPIITPTEDLISGGFLLTKYDTEFTKKEAMEMLYSIGITELPTADRGRGLYSGKLIFSQILPSDLNLEYENKMYTIIKKIKGKVTKKDIEKYDCYFKVEKGKLVSGVFDERATSPKNLIDVIVRHYPIDFISEFYYKLSKLVFYALSKKGLTIALDEYKTTKELQSEIDQKIKELIVSTNAIVKKYENKTLPLVSGKNLDETFEIEMMTAASNVKDYISDKILLEKFNDMYDDRKVSNNNTTMLSSVGGSRGKVLNVVNIIGLWGQVTVRTGRAKNGFKNRLLSSNLLGSNALMDYGFVKNNFYNGMTPKEYFIHSIGGRQGEIDTGVSTKVSGYLYRRLSNALKDLVVQDDLSVKTADGQVVQFTYGDDGLSPDKAYLGKNINFFHE